MQLGKERATGFVEEHVEASRGGRRGSDRGSGRPAPRVSAPGGVRSGAGARYRGLSGVRQIGSAGAAAAPVAGFQAGAGGLVGGWPASGFRWACPSARAGCTG